MDHSEEHIAAFTAFKNEDPNGFDLVFKAFRRMIYVHAFGFLKDAQEAEDITIEVFTILWEEMEERRKMLKSLDHLLSWLFLVSRNRCIDNLRRSNIIKGIYREIKSEDGTSSSVEYEQIHAEFMDRVGTEIDNLPEPMRSVFIMRFTAFVPAQDVATKLGISIETVYTYAKRAKERLRSRLFTQMPEAVLFIIIMLFSKYL
jgi:RNA polymerase sigma-70 factor (ECF subfamily)